MLSLLEAVGAAEERHDGKVAVTIESQTEYFDPPRHKDIDTQAVVNLRRMLTQAGYDASLLSRPRTKTLNPGCRPCRIGTRRGRATNDRAARRHAEPGPASPPQLTQTASPGAFLAIGCRRGQRWISGRRVRPLRLLVVVRELAGRRPGPGA